LKVLLDETSLLTGQIYFSDALTDAIFAEVAPYKQRKAKRDTTNTNDGVLADSHASFCSVREEANCRLAALFIGVDRERRSSRG
jgi:hypothetical protein